MKPDDNRPAISWVNYMSDRDAMNAVNIIGPFRTTMIRDHALARLKALPRGAPEYNGGQEFFSATMAEAVETPGRELTVVAPEQIDGVCTLRAFHGVFFGYDPDED